MADGVKAPKENDPEKRETADREAQEGTTSSPKPAPSQGNGEAMRDHK